MVDPEVLERIAARRAELDELEEQLVKQLGQVRAERDELAVAERVLARMGEQIAGERAVARRGQRRSAGVRCSWYRTAATARTRPRFPATTVGSFRSCGPLAARCR